MNKQEILDKVTTHLLTQNARSEDRYNCLYRGPDGLMCAAGCLIDDGHYFPQMEHQGIHALVAKHPRALPDDIFNVVNLRLIADLQGVHDIHEVKDWPDSLKQVAESHGLQFNPTAQDAHHIKG